jgi:competence ComEA-like helix-hairpin-helix protein
LDFGLRSGLLIGLCILLLPLMASAGADAISEDLHTGLTKYPNCRYIDTQWNDGDSFFVRLTDGTEITARLYEADAIETSINNTTDARRLRAQRRYFGISDYGSDPEDSIRRAITLGKEATAYTRQRLKDRPFTIYTSHADARGGANNKRIYTFIETADGTSLAEELVRRGLARAYGVYRQRPDGLHHAEAKERMRDLELLAAGSRKGIWSYTDWETLPDERLAERIEDLELAAAVRINSALQPGDKINPNTADKRVLETLPGIGPSTAEKIMETREQQFFSTSEDMLRVSGIGAKTLEQIAPYLEFD